MAKNIKTILEGTIINNKIMIGNKKEETFSKVLELTNSAEFKSELKKLGFTLVRDGEHPLSYKYLQFISKDKQYMFFINNDTKYLANINEFGLTQYETSTLQMKDTNTSYERYRELFINLTYDNQQSDFEKLSKYYEVYDKQQSFCNSNVVKQLISLLNEWVDLSNDLSVQNNALQSQIKSIDETEVNDVVEDLLKNGGEIEYDTEKQLEHEYIETEDGGEELVYKLVDYVGRKLIEFKDEHNWKDWEHASKIVVKSKVKGKQSWYIDVYKYNRNELVCVPNVTTTKKQITDWVEGCIKSNRGVEVRTQQNIDTYNEQYDNEKVS